MNIFFDVDFTIIDGDGGLRPGARTLLETLSSRGHRIYLWSGLGPRWETVEQHDLGDFVEGCYDKPLYHYDEMLEPLGIPVRPDFVVDDHPHLVHHYGGCVVKAFRSHDPHDRELDRVLDQIGVPVEATKHGGLSA